MPVEWSDYGKNDQRPSTQGDSTGFIGVQMNTTPNLIVSGYLNLSQNKRINNGRLEDRGGHLQTLLTNLSSDMYNGPTSPNPAGGNITTTIPAPRATIYGQMEYQTAWGQKAGIIFCGSSAYLIYPNGAAQAISYPAGFTLTGACWGVQANTTVVLFTGDGQTPLQYTGAYNTIVTSPTNASATPYQLSQPSIVQDTLAFTYMSQAANATQFLFPIPQGDSAIWFNNRLWVVTSDYVWPSDINDINTYNWEYAIPISSGTNDSLTALVAFGNQTIIAFKTRSVYSIGGIDDTLQNIVVSEIPTGNTGCVSPYGIQAFANDIWYYSGKAIHSLAQAQSSAQQGGEPIDIADDMKPITAQINSFYDSGVVSHVYNNRYLLAVPINGSATNNAVLVYNFINKAWETYDTPGSSEFNVTGFLEMPFLGKSTLFAVSPSGYCFLYDYDTMDCTDRVSGAESYPVTTTTLSRGYGAYQSDFYGNLYGPGMLKKMMQQATVWCWTLGANYSITANMDGPYTSSAIVSNVTRDNISYLTYGTAQWVSTNANLDYASPNRGDYSIKLPSGGTSLGTGIIMGQHQSYPYPYQTPMNGSYFQIQIQNTGGNMIVTHIDVSSATKEQAYERP